MDTKEFLHVHLTSGDWWRMKKDDGVCFIDYICRYFNKNDHIQSLEYDKILYVEVHIQDLLYFENLFDKYFLSSDYFLMILSGFGKFMPCGRRRLKLRLCVEQGGIPVILDCRLSKTQNEFSEQAFFKNAL